MKFFIFIVFLCVLGVQSKDHDSFLNVELVRNPPDPLEVEEYKLDFKNPYFGFECLSKENAMKGLSSYVIHSLDIKKLSKKVYFNVTLPEMEIKADSYDFLGFVFGALPVYGSGSALFKLKNVNQVGDIAFSIIRSTTDHVQLSDLHAEITLGELVSNVSGMLGGGDIDNVINAIIEDLAPDFIHYYTESISEYISENLLGLLN